MRRIEASCSVAERGSVRCVRALPDITDASANAPTSGEMLTKRGRRVMNVDDTVVTRFPACQNARRSGVAPAGGRRRHRR